MNSRQLLWAVFLALSTHIGTAVGGIVVGAWDLGIGADYASDNEVPQWAHNTMATVPFSAVEMVEQGGGRNTTTYDFDQTGDSAHFLFDFDHFRMPGQNSFVESIGFIRFDVPGDSPPLSYAFSGSYAASPSYILEMTVRLTDRTTGDDLFFNHQWSQFTSDESFTLGGLGGDFQSILEGDIEGVLVPNRQYKLNYRYLTFNSPPVAQGGVAQGTLELQITPEPASGLLVLAGALATVSRRRGRHVANFHRNGAPATSA